MNRYSLLEPSRVTFSTSIKVMLLRDAVAILKRKGEIRSSCLTLRTLEEAYLLISLNVELRMLRYTLESILPFLPKVHLGHFKINVIQVPEY